MRGRRIATACLGLLIGACGGSGPSPAPGAGGQPIEIRDARARLMPGMGVAYFTVVNRGATADRLMRVETPAAASAQIHESRVEGSTVRMRELDAGLDVPAGATVELRPGGLHVMLIDPTVDEDETAIELVLTFEKAGEVRLEAPRDAPGGASTGTGR